MMAPDNLIAALRKPPQADRCDEAGEHDPGAIAAMLAALDPTAFGKGHHERWFALMCSVHHASGGKAEDAFVEWSTSDPRYAGDEAIIRQRWRSLSLEAPSPNTGQLFAELQAAGRADLIPQPKAGHLFADLTDADFDFDDPAKRSANDNASDTMAPERSDGAPLDPLSRLGAFTLWQFAERHKRPAMLLDGYIAQGTVTVISGAPGVGKSFFTIGLSASVAFGADSYCGQQIGKHGPVVYCALEGQATMWDRFRAACQHYRLAPTDALRLVEGGVSLRPEDKEATQRLIAICKAARPALIVIDTLSMALSGADTSSERDVAPAIKLAIRIANTFGAAVIVVAHPPKAGGSAIRGSGAIEGNTDATYRFVRDDDEKVLSLEPEKVRWAKEPQALTLQLKAIDLISPEGDFEEDEHGRPVTSAAIIRAQVAKPSFHTLALAQFNSGDPAPGEDGVCRLPASQVGEEWRDKLKIGKSRWHSMLKLFFPEGIQAAKNVAGWKFWREEDAQIDGMARRGTIICAVPPDDFSPDILSAEDIE